MPLQNGAQPNIIKANIHELIAVGHPHDQAIAIALDHARKTGGATAKIKLKPKTP